MLKPELTLNKKNMVELGAEKQIKARDGQARVGVVTGKILRDTSREGHLNEDTLVTTSMTCCRKISVANITTGFPVLKLH